MENNEHQIELSKILGLISPLKGYREAEKDIATWAQIYEAIGRLKQRAEEANKPREITYIPTPQTTTTNNPNLHYHGTHPCYQNPCVWC